MDLNRWLRSTTIICLFITVFIHSSLARYHGRRHKRQNGANLYLSQTYVIPGGEGDDPHEWTEWSSPSECSRSCGGGVSYQTRECLRVGYNGEPLCKGGNKKFFSCNTQDCPEDEPDFRSQQCSRFDSVPFEGERYEWIPYTKAPNPCELNCMPRGERFYYRHKAKVIDGTRCNDESLDVCVDGKCQPVGCDMMIGSDAREDKCRKCAGDGTSCQTINGTVDSNNLQVGYNDIFVIPAGATNIDIREIEPSNNYLACRNKSGHYYLNGNWRIDFPRPMQFAGSWWHYDRKPQGFAAPDHITSMGPTTEAIVVALLYQDRNVGVKYEYSVPEDAVKTNLDTYQWTHTPYGQCSASCGGGFQTREIFCNSRTTLDIVDDSLCDQSARPSDTQQCGTDACVPKWVEGEWGKCSKPCGQDGMQNRTVHCERISADGIVEKVEDSVCLETAGNKPADKQECNRDTTNCPKYHLGPWKPCDKLCGEGTQTRKVTCYTEEDGKKKVLNDSECNVEKPEEEKSCILQPCEGVDWITSSWSGCTECGQTEETRTIKCANKKGKEYDENFCSEQKPEVTRECEKVKKCDFQWFSSEWSKCSTLCGNGTQSRVVICGEFDGTSVTPAPDDSKCNADLKPDNKQDCEIPEDKCEAQWFTGPWQECSKTCGGGTTEREVICLENGEISVNCAEELVEFTSEDCNTQPCEDDETIPVDSTATTISDEDEEEECDYDDYSDIADLAEEIEDKADGKVSEGIDLDGETTTETSLITDDLMMSDSTGFETDSTGFETDSTDESTEEPQSTVDGSGESTIDVTTDEGSGDDESTSTSEGISISTEDTTDFSELSTSTELVSKESSASTIESDTTKTSDATESSSSTEVSSSTTVSGSTEDLDSTESSGATETSDSTRSTDISGASEVTDQSDTSDATTSSSFSDISDLTAESGGTDSSDITGESTDTTGESTITQSTDATTSGTESSGSTEDQTTIEAVSGTTEEEEEGPATEIQEVFDLSDLGVTKKESSSPTLSTDITSTDSTESTSESSTEVSSSTDSSDTTTDQTSTISSDSTTILTSPTPDEECEPDVSSSTEGTSETTSSTNESSSSDASQSTDETVGTDQTTSSDEMVSTDEPGSTTESRSTEESGSTTESGSSTESGSTEEPETTTEPGSTVESGSTEEPGSTEEAGSTEGPGSTKEPGSTEEPGTTEEPGSTQEPGTTAEPGSTEEPASTEESESTQETSSTSEPKSTETSESTEESKSTKDAESTSESGTTDASSTQPDGTTSQESTEIPQSTISTESTDASDSTISSASTVSSTDESSASEGSTEGSSSSVEISTSSDMDSTTIDIWSSTTEEVTDEDDDKTTPNTLEMAITRETKAPKKCKPKKKKDCKKSKYGCCHDNETPAKGPFDEGCPIVETCKETKFGCCSDGVSPAKGENNKGCPKSQCAETLFGCCPDKYTPAEGEDSEGCPEPTTTMAPTTLPPTEETTVKEDDTTDDDKKTDTCSATKYGCCPDGETEAQGENFAGCATEPKEPEGTAETDCTRSEHGCCPDQKTAATGPNGEGCSPCASEPFGCCRDEKTPAHGPYGEGCSCLDSEFGCCPDNINPARGPDNEGCECEYAPFGCCPDKKTPARGYDNEGCGCEYTKFGCCPDKLTIATGPKFEGCPCHTMQFGCCPDGITIPQGPHHYGCHCSQTEFQCCPDEKTPAKGPNKDGCTCAESKYGCCPDGVSSAEGSKFEGCESVPEAPQKACALPKETGPCNNFTIRHFFDTAYGACARFWYGGCEGNGNNFENSEECKATCEEYKGKESCLLPRSPGPCPGNQKMWYYDADRSRCEEFEYGGCFGNTNRFETLEECQSTCSVDDSIPPCEQPVDKGPCDGNFERWYYDNETDVCRPFQYGGCQGNKNNYATEHACVYHCRQPGVHKELCKLSKEEGNCEERHARWHYSETENNCVPFYYTGCGGNKNNFRSLQECEERCPKPIAKDICEIPAQVGECQNYVARWYYDTKDERCRQFYWGGCGGNENNFADEDSCLNRCTKPEPEPEPEQERPQPERQPEISDRLGTLDVPRVQQPETNTQNCYLEYDAGQCENYTTRFYYNYQEGLCDVFAYGGCDGNGNNFENEEDCVNLCGGLRDLCSLPPVYGRCNDNITRWHYDERTRSCHEFEFSGCYGNNNNFETESDCVHYCDRQVQEPPEVPAVDVPTDYCNEPVAQGNCKENIFSFYYDSESGLCHGFYYSGCDGNRNRFETEEQCERQCGHYRGVDVCKERLDPGPCDQYQTRYYYDSVRRICEPFSYGGCAGSGNRFMNMEECESVCIERIEPTRNDRAICFLPANSGNCTDSGQEARRWFYDDSRGACIMFIYSGCAGNQNNFVSYESCVDTCVSPEDVPSPGVEETHEEHDPQQPHESHEPDQPHESHEVNYRCEQDIEHCRTLRCPYGVRRFYDQSSSCERCDCENPCDGFECEEGSRCAIDIAGQDFVPVCRQENKPGECPALTGDNTRCDRECYTDAECRGDYKCCQDGCGTRCVLPAVEEEPHQEPVTAPTPVLYPGDRPAQLEQKPQHEIDVSTPAGGVAILRCFATGYPAPTITWSMGSVTINTNQGRFILTGTGDLTIVQVHRSDSGSYICVADNGLGEPVRREVNLEVENPVETDAYIAGPTNETIYVQLNQPIQLRCPTGGHPSPQVHWWRGKNIIPRSGEHYYIDEDNALVFTNVGLHDLGVYTCEAWNRRGRPASIEKTVVTTTQVHTHNPDDEEYLRYVIQPAHAPTSKPEWPYRPHRPSTTRLPVIVPTQSRRRIPASAVIRRDPSNTYNAGSEIVLLCDVDGVPTPNVTWFKNGIPIEAPSNKYEITEIPHRLVIFDVQREDTGRYACEARNAFSYNRNEETVTVESTTYVHPDCVDNPYFANCALIVKGNYCSNLYYGKFCCRSCTLAGQLTGHPNDL